MRSWLVVSFAVMAGCSSEPRPEQAGEPEPTLRPAPPNSYGGGRGGAANPASDVDGGMAEPEPDPDVQCFADLPAPQLVVNDYVAVSTPTGMVSSIDISVLNFDSYPMDLFLDVPSVPDCGLNPTPSRTWVDFEDGLGNFLIGFCDVDAPDVLAQMTFDFPGAPDDIRVVLSDQICGDVLVSEPVFLAP